MQFVACRFGPIDSRRYTYVNNGDPVEVGDFVKVADARNPDAGWKRVEVMAITDQAPAFECKPILIKITGEDTDEAIQRRAAASH